MARNHIIRWDEDSYRRDRSANRRSVSLGYTPMTGHRRAEISAALNRVHYHAHGWILSAGDRDLVIFRAGPGPDGKTILLRHGPFPIAPEADEDQIIAMAIEAIVSIEGEGARARIEVVGP